MGRSGAKRTPSEAYHRIRVAAWLRAFTVAKSHDPWQNWLSVPRSRFRNLQAAVVETDLGLKRIVMLFDASGSFTVAARLTMPRERTLFVLLVKDECICWTRVTATNWPVRAEESNN